MKKSDFYYDLPKELIAQHPADKRDESRLMLVSRSTGEISDRMFYDIYDELKAGDCLVLNDTKVLPARLYGIKQGTGAKVEFLLLNALEKDTWECLAGPGKRAKPGMVFDFGGIMTGTVTDVLEGGNRVVKFEYEGNFYEVLDKIGLMPLPHYITEELKDNSDYQTVYAKVPGSAACPTAGLHFTNELLEKISDKGVDIEYVTLDVGLGTFRPVKEENIEDHKMHTEHYRISKKTADAINKAHETGNRVICCGTTSCRTLESAAVKFGKICECDDDTSIFIYPGYEYKCMDALITNFHLPESTLIMLVSAFLGYDNTMKAYKHAVDERYRFFSFGDAMFIQ